MYDPNFRPGPLDIHGNHYRFEPANPGHGLDGTYGEPLLKAGPYEQQQWRTWEVPSRSARNEQHSPFAPQQLGQVPLRHTVQANYNQGWPNVTPPTNVQHAPLQEYPGLRRIETPASQAATPVNVKSHEQTSNVRETRTPEIIVDEEKINVNDRMVFVHTGRHMMKMSEDGGGMNIYVFDPRSQQRAVANGATYGPPLPWAMRNLLEDRKFGVIGELPPYKFAEPPKNALAQDERGFGGSNPDNSGRKRFYKQKEQEINSRDRSEEPGPSLVQIEQGNVSWTVLSLGDHFGDSVGRGMTTFAVEGNQSMDQMFERALVAFPKLFEIIPIDKVMQRPQRLQRISLPDSPMVASFKGTRSSRVA